jgi:type III restriction enzyme
MSEKTLYDRYSDGAGTLFHLLPDIPEYITLNLAKEIREYQYYGLSYFIKSQTDPADIHNHLLFRMATGSGKTLMMAGCILYLFKRFGHQNFLFFVNSDAILKKTHENFLNDYSLKYLFNKDGIFIDGQKIEIKEVTVFPVTPEANTIYLKLSTIQKLHTDLNNPVENEPTFDFFEENNVVMLADEAHHLNAYTKSKGSLTKDEVASKDWETTILALLNCNPENKLLEFTATMDLENPSIFNKYKDKLVFNYDLTRFMEDKFSKNVILLRSNQDDNLKLLNGILLSQYRKYIAADNGIYLKPIILFKSSKIAISTKAHDNLLDIIEKLTPQLLEKHLEESLETYADPQLIFNKAFRYLQKLNSSKVIGDLREDFNEKNILNANKKEFLSSENSILLNTLEDTNNPIRAIFAVAKLNEGWDVLNLYDIVRISEEASKTLNTTDSEAQLIGRGARYYPFKYKDRESYTRRFDTIPSELKVLEELHYHTINESGYIKNLSASLKAAGVTTSEERLEYFEANLKHPFTDSSFYKKGYIYQNKRTEATPINYQNLMDYGISLEYKPSNNLDIQQNLKEFLANKPLNDTDEDDLKVEYTNIKIPDNIWRKAMQRNPFFHYSNLKKFVNNVSSVSNFIESPDYLASVEIKIDKNKVSNLTANHLLSLAESYLSYILPSLKNNYLKPKGLYNFEPLKVSEVVEDYNFSMTISNTKTSQKILSIPKRHSWFVYDNSIGNSLEQQLVDYISTIYPILKSKYKNIYLIRNEKKIKLIEFGKTRGFMPDYLLCFEDDETFYQVFLEPKGGINLAEKDAWKEAFLSEISTNEKVTVEDNPLGKKVEIIGVKFFNTDSKRLNEFKEDLFNKLNISIEEEEIKFNQYIDI